MMSWVFGDKAPIAATGTGGHQVVTSQDVGNCFDHFAIMYEYEAGAKGFHFSRKQAGCSSAYTVEVLGTKGHCLVDCMRGTHRITTHDGKTWNYRSEQKVDMYQNEHDELFASIRKGQPINDGEWMGQSTMLALMGRMVAYTGQTITYADALNSREVLAPEKINLSETFAGNPISQPGMTKFF
jgi:predicted dehydrogenase